MQYKDYSFGFHVLNKSESRFLGYRPNYFGFWLFAVSFKVSE